MVRLASFVLVLAAAACGGDPVVPIDATLIDAPTDAPPCPTPRLIYLNRTGGTYNPAAQDNASTNATSFVQVPTVVAAPQIQMVNWNSYLTCLHGKFADYNLELTETDPGLARHSEVVIATASADIGLPANLQYIAHFGCAPTGGAGNVDNTIMFVMWNSVMTNDARCILTAEAIGNILGLDAAYSCPDVMSTLTACGPVGTKTFTDLDVPCGTTAMRSCTCLPGMQNSAMRLGEVLGPHCP